MDLPKIYLAIDNCFASKRWTQPQEWMREVSNLGIHCIEASADTELDPLYHGKPYLKRWCEEVLEGQQRYGTKVVNLYSGHGTYATLGLMHTDDEIGERFLTQWIQPMLDTAESLEAGLGFFCHGFHQEILNNPEMYNEAYNKLIDRLAHIAQYASDSCPSVAYVGIEQMYTPHQVPWRIEQTRDLLQKIFQKDGNPFYFTLDVGHQSGQWKFLKPSFEQITDRIRRIRENKDSPSSWTGSDSEYDYLIKLSQISSLDDRRLAEQFLEFSKAFQHMYAQSLDSDPHSWVKELVGWSPIIHLQQTDGRSSSHLPFTDEANRKGIIRAEELLRSMHKHFLTDNKKNVSMPPKVKDIYLTLEIFSSTAETPNQIREKLQQSVAYWRKAVPEDGMSLDKVIEHLDS